MTPPSAAERPGIPRFRVKLLLAMMLVVSVMTCVGLYLAHRNVAADAEHDLRQDFQAQLTAEHRAEEVRYAALAESCRALVAKPRIHAALEDNALDLLYPSAKDELRDLIAARKNETSSAAAPLQATFYRFLDRQGAVIFAPNAGDAGELRPDEEMQLNLHALPKNQEIGYLWKRPGEPSETIDEVIVVPIASTETGELISALVVGFKPIELQGRSGDGGMKRGLWLKGRLHLPALSSAAQGLLADRLSQAANSPDSSGFSISLDGEPYLVFHKPLNPGSIFPTAHEVYSYPLTQGFGRQRRLQWEIVGAGFGLLLLGFIGSHFVSARLSAPVEQLAVESEENRAERARAEAELATTSEELERSERFSANASHQLKSPVAVLRAGLESLLRREGFPSDAYDEFSSLLHQTYRLTGVIEDLLLLSRMDAGRLRIDFGTVNLTRLIEEWVDDLSALPDGLAVELETEISPDLYIAGEQRYTALIVQNLLENARKYNRPNGRIRIIARSEEQWAYLCVGNTGRPIPPAAQEHIFERFHRAGAGASVPGHGLGLNLARDLARLHGGELRLARSGNDWTEFEVRLRIAKRIQGAGKRSDENFGDPHFMPRGGDGERV